MIKIYHNPKCSKSIKTLELIKRLGKPHEIIHYLEVKPNEDILRKAFNELGEKLLRKNEETYKTHMLNTSWTEDSFVEAIKLHPIILERPLVINGERMALGRPPEDVLDIL